MNPFTTQDKVFALSTMTTRDHAGRHFRERYPDDLLDALERENLILVHRSIHEPTGIPYSHQYDIVEVTQEGIDLVEVNPEYHDTSFIG